MTRQEIEKDAARYRWLRANAEDIVWPTGEVFGLPFLKGGRAFLDTAIDARIAIDRAIEMGAEASND